MKLGTEMNFLLLLLLFTSTIPFFVNMQRPKKNVTEKYYINTPGCKMVYKDAFSKEALQMFKKLDPLVCAKEPPLIESDQTSIWISNEARKARKLTSYLRCCYRSFWRPISTNYEKNVRVDFQIRFNPTCTHFKNKTMIYDEFIEVLCFNGNQQVYRDFHAFVPRTKMNTRKHPHEKPSVILIGIDSLSRGNLERHMPKTLKYVRSLEPFEMHGLNKIGDGTIHNMVGVLSGVSTNELTCWETSYTYFDKCKFLWDYYRESNYTTAFAEESSYIGIFTYLRKGFRKQPTDIYANPFILMNEDYVGIGHNIDYIRQCAGARSTAQILLDYAKKVIFNITALNKPLMGYFWVTTVAHDDINLHSDTDLMFHSFLTSLYKSGIFKNSVVLFMSDHGLRFGDFRKTYQGYLEERQPFAFFFIPPWMRQKYPEAMQNMNDNQHKLSTPFDLGATLLNILHLEDFGQSFKYGNGFSLFSEINSNRTCRMAQIPDHFCTCYTSEEAQLPQKEIEIIANTIVAEINIILTNVSSVCSTLSLDKVLTVRENKLPSDAEANYTDYVTLLLAKPGGGYFEGTVRINSTLKSPQVMGHISRTNKYSNNLCINDKFLRLYCDCKEIKPTTTVTSRRLTTVPPLQPKLSKKYGNQKPTKHFKRLGTEQYQKQNNVKRQQRGNNGQKQHKKNERAKLPTWEYANYWEIKL